MNLRDLIFKDIELDDLTFVPTHDHGGLNKKSSQSADEVELLEFILASKNSTC
jgi:hypothetical protein